MRQAQLFRFGLIACLSAAGALSAAAADLDGAYPPSPRVVQAPPPPPNCRVIAQPRLNLTKEDVEGARPQIVCFSRGILADTMQPYPVYVPRAWWDFRP